MLESLRCFLRPNLVPRTHCPTASCKSNSFAAFNPSPAPVSVSSSQFYNAHPPSFSPPVLTSSPRVSPSRFPLQSSKAQTFQGSEISSMASESKIQLYSIATPNGQKIGIALEEMGIPYDAHTVNIMKGDQFKPEFLAINPNNKIPAIVDPTGSPGGKPLPIFESGAILMYLAEKSGKFLPTDPVHRWETLEWLFFQVGGVGPMFGQFGVFFKYARDKCDHPFPLERYTTEAKRLLGVLEKRLEGREFVVDAGYTIADMAIFPWVRSLKHGYGAEEKLELASFPNVKTYVARCEARPLTAKGLTVCPFP